MQFLSSLLLKCCKDWRFNLMAGLSLVHHRNKQKKTTKSQNGALDCLPKIKSNPCCHLIV